MDGKFNSEKRLVNHLNELLKHLSLSSIMIETPYDLTPTLLVIILESILRHRLPIPPEIRNSTEQGPKIEMMKILLGILEDDILEQDIGLSEIDPKKLAAGELDEAVFVGQVLCQLGYERLMLKSPSSSASSSSSPLPPPPPSFHLDNSNEDQEKRTRTGAMRRPSSRANTFSNAIDSSYYPESETALTSIFDGSITPTGHRPSSSPSPSSSRPKCIHKLEFPEFSFDQDIEEDSGDGDDDCDYSIESYGVPDLGTTEMTSQSSSSSTSIRRENYIRRVSELEEIREFESKHNRLPKTPPCKKDTPEMRNPNPNKYTSPTQYTLALLHERAQLLEELAHLKLIKASGSIHP